MRVLMTLQTWRQGHISQFSSHGGRYGVRSTWRDVLEGHGRVHGNHASDSADSERERWRQGLSLYER